MRKRFFLAAVLATLWASAGCETWLHHHGYYPNGTPGGAPAANYCVPCVPCTPTAAYQPPVAGPSSWTSPTGPAAGAVCCPPQTQVPHY